MLKESYAVNCARKLLSNLANLERPVGEPSKKGV
jgi:hypothetical protein